MIAQRRVLAPRRRFAARAQGFSLMELMIVVAITGVLAAIAIPTFSTYVYKSRTSEATQFLGVIKLKQESYRAEFGGYYQCPANADNMTDFAYVPDDESGMKNSISLPLNDACFGALGAAPDGPVRFGYAWIAGTPSTITASVASDLNIPAGSYDHYFVAHAVSDLDGDGTPVFFELSNFTKNVYIMNADGTPSITGWE